MIEQKLRTDEKELNELLKELEQISKKIQMSPLNDLDKNLFIEFLERAYYSRDVIRKKAGKLSKKRVE